MMNMRAAVALAAAAALPARAALPTVAAAASQPASAPGFGQAAFGLLLVLAIIFGCAWLARRLGVQRLGGSRLVTVVSSAALGPRERVVVVAVADRWLVLGVTPTQVTRLHDIPAQALPPAPSAPDAPVAMAALFSQKLREALGVGRPPR
jgi:flagellar protein FliO/FliZ